MAHHGTKSSSKSKYYIRKCDDKFCIVKNGKVKSRHNSRGLASKQKKKLEKD